MSAFPSLPSPNRLQEATPWPFSDSRDFRLSVRPTGFLPSASWTDALGHMLQRQGVWAASGGEVIDRYRNNRPVG